MNLFFSIITNYLRFMKYDFVNDIFKEFIGNKYMKNISIK
jgi:hypothetical protein